MSEFNQSEVAEVAQELRQGNNYVMNAIRSMSTEGVAELFDALKTASGDLKKWLRGKQPSEISRSSLSNVCDLPLLLHYDTLLMNTPLCTNFTEDQDSRPDILPQGNASPATKLQEKIFFKLVNSSLTPKLHDYIKRLRADVEALKNPENKDWVTGLDKLISKNVGYNLDSAEAEVSNRVEKPAEKKFEAIVCTPLISFLTSHKLDVTGNPVAGPFIVGANDRFELDIAISKGHQVLTFIEMKRRGLYLYGNNLGLTNPSNDTERNYLHSILHQIANYLLQNGICICLVSDYKTTYVVELAFDDEEWKNDPTTIPIRSYAIDIKYNDDQSDKLPLQMVLTAIVWNQYHLPETERLKNEEALKQLRDLLYKDMPPPTNQDPSVVFHTSTDDGKSPASNSSPGGSTADGQGRSGHSNPSRQDQTTPSDDTTTETRPSGQATSGDPHTDSLSSAPNTASSSDPSTAPSSGSIDDYPKDIIYYNPEYKDFKGITRDFGALPNGSSHNTVHTSEYDTFQGFHMLQKNYHRPAIVLWTEQQNLLKYFPNIAFQPYEPNRKVVMKIFDYYHMDDCFGECPYLNSYDEFISLQHEQVIQEIKCYNRIQQYNEGVGESDRIRVPKLYDYGNLHMKSKSRKTRYEGSFILLDYAGEEVSSITDAQYHDGRRQLRKMGQLGIFYPYVTRRNLRVKDGNLMFIDFNSCKIPVHGLNSTSLNNLTNIWLEGEEAEAEEYEPM